MSFDYSTCLKIPSKGGWSRGQVNDYATSLGINPKEYRTKEILCKAIQDHLETPLIEKDDKESKVEEKHISEQQKGPLTNQVIADLLTKLSAQFIRERETHRGKAFKTGANIIRSLSEPLTSVEQIKDIKAGGLHSYSTVGKQIVLELTLNEPAAGVSPEFTKISVMSK